MACGVFILAHDATLTIAGDYFGVSPTQAFRCLEQLIGAVQRSPDLNKDYWPNTEVEKQHVAAGFRALLSKGSQHPGYPHVIGALDGTHIKMLRPGGADYMGWYNRKGHTSINSVAVVRADGVFTYFCAGYCGSTADIVALKRSALGRNFERMVPAPYRIVADSGYVQLRNMHTPYRNPKVGRLSPTQMHVSATHDASFSSLLRSSPNKTFLYYPSPGTTHLYSTTSVTRGRVLGLSVRSVR